MKKTMESRVRANNLVLCSGYNAATLSFISAKEVFSVQEAWHSSPNTLLTMIHDHVFSITT
jgi:hypothetical protein